MTQKRYVILAEGFSADPHYGKTARGILHYSPHPTVAIVDSTRAGETMDGAPVVATIAEALAFQPTTAIVGVATQGGRFPPAWKALLRECIDAGLDVESGLHEFLADDVELSELARTHGVELRDLRRPPEDVNVPTGANLEVDAKIVLTVGSDCAIGKKTVKPAAAVSSRSSARLARRVSRSPGGASLWTLSSPTSSRGRPSESSSRAPSAAAGCSSSRARGRSCTRSTPA
jgi:uncharacterized NAD-dependent epimerase/dehydratase family protein